MRDDDGSLPKGERRTLTAVAQYPEGTSRKQLSVLTGYTRRTRDSYLQKLRERNFIEQDGDLVVATEPGVQALGNDFEQLPTGGALLNYWLQRLPEGQRRILESVVAVYPDPVERERIDEETGYTRRTRDSYIQPLAARRLVEIIGRGQVKASAMLFD